MQRALAGHASVDLRKCQSQIGSGSLPIELLPSCALVITPSITGRGSGTALKRLEKQFRELPVPILARISEGALWLDLRCLEDDATFLAQLTALEGKMQET